MKKLTLIAFSFVLFFTPKLFAQWQLGGNDLNSSQRIGSNTNYSLLFETNNSERGRITNGGLWGIGTTSPNTKLHVNSATGQDPFRVAINGDTKLWINQYGTVAIGTTSPSSSYKLYISSSSASGIYSNGTDYGVRGTSPNIGVQGYGSVKGVFGYSNTANGKGVNGYAEQNYGGFFESYDGTALYAKTYNGFYAALFYGNTYSSGTYYGSDKNIKKNIQEVGNAMSIINRLKPKYYQFREDAEYASLQLPKGNHYGLLAQDVEEVLPNLVKESSHEVSTTKPIILTEPAADGKFTPVVVEPKETKKTITIKAVNYTELIPLLIKGLQEQQQTISTLQEEIMKLKAASNTGYTSNLNNLERLGVSLEQNSPNPANQNTTFRYTIPAGLQAQILVYNATSGKLVKTLAAPGTGQVQMSSNNLPAGIYIYNLVVEGKLMASKQMVISE
ncbi:hypothetical protein AHMF7605_01835 [Adhaeribacter arboris]|uniref:Peptidase S74 domain-containing protein n=1 Tax=Adhaeribacter arboris TaxID=2072846 RepID=A0A2T2Y9Z3_9BACT|nr:tail fiber domain-containing protein [Adhaeribacter arboris]PSR52350.1 hypothetical protein AHMF7605_01835 [Adhaeribacter arboris]